MKNQFDTRNRSAFDIFADLRATKGFKLAVLGSQNIAAAEAADALVEHKEGIINACGGVVPVRLITGCRPVGAEKAVRIAAKEITGRLAAVFHRAEMTYGIKAADEMTLGLIAQEADALLVLSAGKKTCAFARARFIARHKKVYEIEIE